ncbi:DUF4190 domain-containing protein [Streptomyces sp. NBC_01431]|uniref:DUF4190 domain-containing protein n=1 Tax=Streptomyces sp. NBC_01431 TaxID=2903863 RepID=UPI002E32525E|nr:DUF4190 domain-containing protein [Streptomyces sp. NBC_01431]
MEIPPPPAPGQPQQPQPQPGPGYGWPQQNQVPGGYPAPPVNTGPWYPYPPAPQQPPLSGLAIGSLVAGILCCVPPLGLVLGAVALGQIKKRGLRGKGMAITGIVFSTISTILMVLAIATGGLASSWRDFKSGWNESSTGTGSKSRSTLDLHSGDCFDVPGGKLDREVASVRIVPCAGAHDAEVSGTFRLAANGVYPGESAISAEADAKCWNLEQAYAMDRWKIPAEAGPYYYTPSAQSWGLGDHTVTCAFAAQGGKLEGSVRNDASTLDRDQIAFLKSANAFDRVMAKAPDEDRAEDDLPGFRTWARQTSDVLAQQTRQLDAQGWSAGHLDAVRPYIAGLKTAQKEWAKAADAPDANAFYLHSGAADRAMKQSTEIAARGALGLATTPPATDDAPGGSGDGSEGASGGPSESGGSGSGSGGSSGSAGSGSGGSSGIGGSKSV